MAKFYWAEDLVGGAAGALDAINTTGWTGGDLPAKAIVQDGVSTLFYHYNPSNNAGVDDVPNFIDCDNGPGGWELQAPTLICVTQDPISPVNNTFWLRTDLDQLRVKINGATVIFNAFQVVND